MLPGNLRFDEFREKDQRFLPAHVTGFQREYVRETSCTTVISVPHDTFLNVTVTWISPGRFGSSNLSV
jgi:hypothetical protein